MAETKTLPTWLVRWTSSEGKRETSRVTAKTADGLTSLIESADGRIDSVEEIR